MPLKKYETKASSLKPRNLTPLAVDSVSETQQSASSSILVALDFYEWYNNYLWHEVDGPQEGFVQEVFPV